LEIHPRLIKKEDLKNKEMNLARVRGQTKKGLIFVISGPSGTGKTTLAKKVLQQPQLKDKFARSVSFTTRPRRSGERQGKDYFFVSAREFRRLLKAKKILEHTRYLGYDYGTPRAFVEQAEREGLHIVLCLDINGALFLKKAYPERTITIFVNPPSLRIAKERILGRSNKTRPEEVDRRIRLASKEVGYAEQYDYCLVNDTLNKAIKEATKIIQQVLAKQQ